MHSKVDPQSRILSGALAAALATLHHGEMIFLCDGGMVTSATSLHPLPDEVEMIDLAVVTGVPSLAHLLPVICETGDIEKVVVAQEMREANPSDRQLLDDVFGANAVEEIPYDEMYALRDRAKLVVRTGHWGMHGNVILRGGYVSPDVSLKRLFTGARAAPSPVGGESPV